MPAVARRPASPPKKPDTIDIAQGKAMVLADTFVRTARERNAAEKEYQKAKSALRSWLGKAQSKVLPDGRTVSIATVDTEAYNVKAGTKTTLTVSSPPAPD